MTGELAVYGSKQRNPGPALLARLWAGLLENLPGVDVAVLPAPEAMRRYDQDGIVIRAQRPGSPAAVVTLAPASITDASLFRLAPWLARQIAAILDRETEDRSA